MCNENIEKNVWYVLHIMDLTNQSLEEIKTDGL